MIVYIQAIFITWSKLVPGGVVICHSRCQTNFSKLLETIWWVLSNVSLIIGIYSVVPEIIANETYSYW